MASKRGMSAKDILLRDFPSSLADETASVFIGAGLSMAAGYPSWKDLLQEIGDELGVKTDDVQDLAALAQWHIGRNSGATKIKQIIRDKIGVEHTVPSSLEVIARLPLRHIWTTNYDRLVERAFSEIRRPIEPISSSKDLTLRPKVGATRLYKMHGTVDRLDDIVISTEDYELFRSKRGGFLPLLQAHLQSLSLLFVGLSFTDPNLRHVLSLIRETFTDAPPEHFAIVRPPQRESYSTEDEYEARLKQHDLWAEDLKRYGLRAIEIESYDETPGILKLIERRLAERRVWVSGSWPINLPDSSSNPSSEYVYNVAEKLGSALGKAGLTLVSGSGIFVGPAVLSGFLSALQESGTWSLDSRLISRPFPQPFAENDPVIEQWEMLRSELARISGIVIFIAGAKLRAGNFVDADGVLSEFELAKRNGSFLLPIGATGGTAKRIAEDLRTRPSSKLYPSNETLSVLLDESKSPSEIVSVVMKIIREISKA